APCYLNESGCLDDLFDSACASHAQQYCNLFAEWYFIHDTVNYCAVWTVSS
ncbi:28966_t:CDS:1, partial [Racocetra persica]